MGSGGSKPEQHIFNADAPVRFSQSVVNSLQSSPETDSTRAKDTELKIQTRVNAELKRIRDSQAQQLTSRTASLTTNPPSSTSQSTSSSPGAHDPNSLAHHLSSPFYQDHTSPSGSSASPNKHPTERTHDSVEKEIMDLRQKLEARKQLVKATPEVEKAKEELVTCLRMNDRRPLDCWEEVEKFKREVGRLEGEFVKKVGR